MVVCRFRALVVPYRMSAASTLYEIINVCDIVSAFIHLPGIITSSDFFYNNVAVFHAKQLILLAPFGAVIKPLASCMVLQFWGYVFKWQLMCRSSITERDFPLIFLLLFMFL